jgi:hypothetical protein
MNREFLDFYNRELSLLYEQAGEFADQYPGIAERLGGLVRDAPIRWLLACSKAPHSWPPGFSSS